MKAPNVHGMKVKRPLRAKCRCMFMYYVLRYESTQCAWNESEKTFKVTGKRLAHRSAAGAMFHEYYYTK